MRVNYVIILVSDMARSVAFYRDVFGLPLKFESPGWTEFATEGSTVALHPADGPAPDRSRSAPDQSTAGPAQRSSEPGRCRPGWTVGDLDAYHEKLIAQGVQCIQEPTETFGVWIAQYLDPDGLAISVSGEKKTG